MKKALLLLSLLCGTTAASAQGWPTKYDGVMMQAFYWDSYVDTQWTALEAQADQIAPWIQLIWVPNSGNCATSGNVMGYCPVYWYDHNSSFGSESQLRSMIQTYKQRGTGFLFDAVLNHRSGKDSWMGFPAEVNPLDGVTYQLTAADVCSTDEVNSDKSAGAEYGKATGAAEDPSKYQDFGGSRDLDHSSANVQKNVIAYLKYLREELGYAGFRYDMVKGYPGEMMEVYNKAAFGDDQIFSVGEFWDGNVAAVGGWLTETKGSGTAPNSAAFDFPLKFALNSCCNYGGYYADNLSGSTSALMRSASYRRYAVTFAENHDTNYEQNKSGDCLKADTLAANAYILGASGTPCVFIQHWKKWAPEIQNLIRARHAAGITNNLAITEKEAVKGKDGYFAWTCGNLYGVVGNAEKCAAPAGYTSIIYAPARHYAYYLKNTAEMAWCDVESRTFEDPFTLTLSAVSEKADAQVVYTLDGSAPTLTNGTRCASGTKLNINGTATLKYALLADGVLGAVETREYRYTPFIRHDATIYVSTDLPSTWEAGYCNFHVWSSEQHQLTTAGWPGDKKQTTRPADIARTDDGRTWFKVTFPITASDYYINIVCSTANGSPQTIDFTGIKDDVYLEVSEEMNNEKHFFNDVTSRYATTDGLHTVLSPSVSSSAIYDLNGRRVTTPARGLYIQNGRVNLGR